MLPCCCLSSLLGTRHGFRPRPEERRCEPVRQGAVALAVPLVWVLLGTAEGSTLSKTLDWCPYSILGVLYAVSARALILAMLGWRDAPQSARAELQ